ncbi:MAG: imidazole glycerol phosphate synthase subunit HisF [Actinomycetota bacterium]|jgi:cyclase
MSLAIRVIPCLDVDKGRTVKGVNFQNLSDAGDPVSLAEHYGTSGADEITFLDISASVEERATILDVLRRTAETLFIPMTVGGGIRSTHDVDQLLRAGADKVSVNTAALNRPDLINDIAEKFGSQVLVLSVDARRAEGKFEVTTHGGRQGTDIDALDWISDAQRRGVGEILLNSIDADGTQDGFDIEMISAVRQVTSLPLIASGGAGTLSDFPAALKAGADAVLAASVFHFGKFTIADVKREISQAGFVVR